MNVLPACMSVHRVHAWCLQETEEVLDPLEPELTDGSRQLMWVLGTKPRSFAGADSAFKC